ncbi:MAG: hypothetical protein K2W97_00185 [Chthoniobacterales bacterium]|nr:hypothetical protein [Chthoniobacterales bacterium]
MEIHPAGLTPPIPLPGGNTNLPFVGKKTAPLPPSVTGSLFKEREPNHLPAKNVIAGSKFSIPSFATPSLDSSHTTQQKVQISGGLFTKENSDYTPSKKSISLPTLKLPSFIASSSTSFQANRDRRESFYGSPYPDSTETPRVKDALNILGLGDLGLEKELEKKSLKLSPLGEINFSSGRIRKSKSDDSSSVMSNSPSSTASSIATTREGASTTPINTPESESPVPFFSPQQAPLAPIQGKTD